jgi:hypothetical protein
VIKFNNKLEINFLDEYLKVWDQNRSDPLSALLIALTFSHIACQKDINSRHLLAMRVRFKILIII